MDETSFRIKNSFQDVLKRILRNWVSRGDLRWTDLVQYRVRWQASVEMSRVAVCYECIVYYDLLIKLFFNTSIKLSTVLLQ
jgi:hypothetical protein